MRGSSHVTFHSGLVLIVEGSLLRGLLLKLRDFFFLIGREWPVPDLSIWGSFSRGHGAHLHGSCLYYLKLVWILRVSSWAGWSGSISSDLVGSVDVDFGGVAPNHILSRSDEESLLLLSLVHDRVGELALSQLLKSLG